MNSFLPAAMLLVLCGALSAAAQADATASLLVAQNLPGAASNNPYNSPIHRANPNSMQGTQPSAPAIRSPNTVPAPRPPTLDNGGIGNRYPAQTTPSSPPKFIPNPPPRDSGSNR
ncbi:MULTISPECIES: hypothetical protein [unclassified Pseudomonas]|jgi:hypothetical protein|uniref:hypothetical protein n=1 Tax=unclassified Pseudomonas TaxID=196821 RepID=UPI00069FD605|nr:MULTISPECIES: hypothetical protein [unclassified Pseudomonas]WPN49828.1 hypothetical protein QMK58_14670 [Pseudomonas sp. P8_241]